MESWSISRAHPILPSSPLLYPHTPTKHISQFHFPKLKKTHQNQTQHSTFIHFATMNKNPKGFGPSSSKKTKKTKKSNNTINDDDEEEEKDDGDDDEGGVIPEVVTNRMISRVGFTVGIPLLIGLLFFPFFYYLKVGLKIDLPTWIPYLISFFFFGTALLGVSYGIVSSSWDPYREGSLLGWNEAKKNWPVFWQSLRGKSGNK